MILLQSASASYFNLDKSEIKILWNTAPKDDKTTIFKTSIKETLKEKQQTKKTTLSVPLYSGQSFPVFKCFDVKHFFKNTFVLCLLRTCYSLRMTKCPSKKTLCIKSHINRQS